MIDQFWAKVDLGDRDRTDLSQFTKIGEEFFPTNRPRTIPVIHFWFAALMKSEK